MPSPNLTFIPQTFDATRSVPPPASLAAVCPSIIEEGEFHHVKYVGVSDYTIQGFHGVPLNRGTSYNSYLIHYEPGSYALVDSVKANYFDNWIANIQSVVGGVGSFDSLSKIKYIISLHAEPDHSGCIPYFMAICPSARLLATRLCRQVLQRFYPFLQKLPEERWTAVDEGTSMKLGGFDLRFQPVPLLHWPDNTVLTLHHAEEDRAVMFTSDALGAHIATSEHFADTWLKNSGSMETLKNEVIDYHTSIVGPYLRKQLLSFIEKVLNPNLPKLIAILPAHGLIYRTPEVIEAVEQTAKELTHPHADEKEVVVLFATMYGGSQVLAEVAHQALVDKGMKATLVNAETVKVVRLSRLAWRASGFLFIGPTLHNRIYPALQKAISEVAGLRLLEDKPVWIAGTFGWAKNAFAKHMEELLEDSGALLWKGEHSLSPLMVNWRGSEDDYEEIRKLVDEIVTSIEKGDTPKAK